ncbi:MAG: hypothetical protein DRI61_15125 [Chloroflexi bacterium]|nr:MAG: hypothetical protein DRI61_15125 [Chloroflexota bacterium]
MKTLCYLLDEVKDSWDVELEPDEKEKVRTALTVVDGYYWKDLGEAEVVKRRVANLIGIPSRGGWLKMKELDVFKLGSQFWIPVEVWNREMM